MLIAGHFAGGSRMIIHHEWRHCMHKRVITAALVTGATVIATAVAATGSASAAPSRSTVPHTKPAWVAHAHQLGRASNHAKVTSRVYLAPRGGLAALKQAANAVSTKGSASYHHFLSAAQYRKTYGTTNATVRQVSN